MIITIKVVSITILSVAAFLNAAALGERVALKNHDIKNAIYHIGCFALDIVLVLLVFNGV